VVWAASSIAVGSGHRVVGGAGFEPAAPGDGMVEHAVHDLGVDLDLRHRRRDGPSDVPDLELDSSALEPCLASYTLTSH
jgi:hypothetical protein